MSDLTFYRRRLVVNSSLMAVSRCGSMMFVLVALPIIIATLGPAAYGRWETLLALGAFGAIFQNASIATVLWQASMAYGTNDAEKVRRLLRIVLLFTILQAMVILPVTFAISLNVGQLLGGTWQSVKGDAVILPTVCGLLLVGGFLDSVGAAISGFQRAGWVTGVQALAQIINYSVVIACLSAGGGASSLLAGLICGYIFAASAYLYVGGRVFGRLRFFPAIPRVDELRELWPFFWITLISSMAGVFRDQKDKLLLAVLASPAWAGYYAVALRLSAFITLLNTFFYAPFMTSVGAMFAVDNWAGIRRLHSDTTFITAFIIGGMAIIVGGFSSELVHLWMGAQMPEASALVRWIVVGSVFAIVLTGTGTAICKGTGKPRLEVEYLLVGTAINVLLTAILIYFMGPFGTVIATVTSTLLSSGWFLIRLNKQLPLEIPTSKRAVKTAFLIVLFIAVTHFTLSASTVDSLSRDFRAIVLGIAALMTVVFYWFVLWSLGLSPRVIRPPDLRAMFRT